MQWGGTSAIAPSGRVLGRDLGTVPPYDRRRVGNGMVSGGLDGGPTSRRGGS
jgi:hypothetical protein